MNELAQCHYSDNRGAETEERMETAKELLENMGDILMELNIQVHIIAEALYRGVDKVPDESKETKPMIAIMKDQRDMAESALREVMRIRAVLW